MRHPIATRRAVISLTALALLPGCGGGGGDGGTGPTPKPVSSVTVSPPTANLAPQQTAQLSATVRDATGAVLTDRVVTWNSSAPQQASVSNTGLVTALTPGTVTITATSEGKSGTAQVTVTQPQAPVASVTVSGPTSTLVPQQTVQLTAVTKDQGGATLTGRTVSWTSSQPAVATVNPTTGLVTALAAGATTVTATSEGISGTMLITVSAGALIGTSGGTVTAGNGSIAVIVPPGALPTPTPISLTPIPVPSSPAPASVTFSGPVYVIGPPGLNFAQPVTIRMKYDVNTLPKWIMTGDLRVFLSNGAQWSQLGNAAVDTAAGTISGTTTSIGSSFRRSGRSVGAGPGAAGGAGPAGNVAEPDQHGPNVTPGANPPTLHLDPQDASVNINQRSVHLHAFVSGVGGGIRVPGPPGASTPVPFWRVRWRTSGQKGTLGGGVTQTAWGQTYDMQYIATSPTLDQETGEIDKVWVELTTDMTSANPTPMQTIECRVRGNLEVTYEVVPDNKTIGPGVAQNFQLVIKDRLGNIIPPGNGTEITWTGTGLNHGMLTGLRQETSTYTSNTTFNFPPPRVDRLDVKVDGVTTYQRRETHWEFRPLETPPIQLVTTITPETVRLERGTAKAFVTVKVDYTVALQPNSGKISAGATRQLNVVLTPPYDGPGLKYKYTNAAAQGTLNVTNGERTDTKQVVYTAKNFATGGTDQISVQVVSFVGGVELETLGTGQAAVEVDPWRPVACTPEQDFNGASWFTAYQIRMAKVTGATSYEVQVTKHDGAPYNRTFSGATSTNFRTVDQVLDGGSTWKINLDGGFNTIESAATSRWNLYVAYCNNTTGKYKVTGPP